MMPSKKKTTQKEPEVKAPVTDSNPPPVELSETYKHDVDAVMRREYGDLLRNPDATLILMAILKELVKARVNR